MPEHGAWHAPIARLEPIHDNHGRVIAVANRAQENLVPDVRYTGWIVARVCSRQLHSLNREFGCRLLANLINGRPVVVPGDGHAGAVEEDRVVIGTYSGIARRK